MLLKNLSGEKNRKAHFTSAVAFVYPDGREIVVEGHTYGTITHEERGTGGFGYDCLFFSDDLQKTFAEATAEEKNTVSHRYRALKELRAKWKEQDL